MAAFDFTISHNNEDNGFLNECHEKEAMAVQSFLAECWQLPCGRQRLQRLSDSERLSLALLFLRARKWDPLRSLRLFREHERLRRHQGFERIDPLQPGVSAELLSEKFTIVRADTGAVCALFSARRHHPPTTTHRDTLKGLTFQLDAAMTSRAAQESGLVFVYDMTGSRYGNFDYDLSINILNMLQGSYPARLRKVLIAAAPVWFRAPLQVLRLFVREKLRDRVHQVDRLPCNLQSKRHSHLLWLREAFERSGLVMPDDFGRRTPQAPLADEQDSCCSSSSDSDRGDCNAEVEHQHQHQHQHQHHQSSIPLSPDSSLTLSEFSLRVSSLQREGLVSEFVNCLGGASRCLGGGTCDAFRLPGNREKNRYVDVPCLDSSRVLLSNGEYVHANWVDGYNCPGEYICTQGPLQNTQDSFWLMAWECQVSVVVMATRIVEGRRQKCWQYWPSQPGQSGQYGRLIVACDSVDSAHRDFVITRLRIGDASCQDSAWRQIEHVQLTSWPDFGVPPTAAGFLDCLGHVRQARRTNPDSPVLVHCSAGIGRTGTFIAVDRALLQLADTGRLSMLSIVRDIRSQRAGAIQTPDQYVFCHIAVLEHAARLNLLV